MKKWIGLLLIMVCVTIVSAQTKKKKVSKAKPNTTRVAVANKQEPTILNNSLLLCASKDSMPAWYLNEPADFRFPANYPVPTQYQLYATVYNWFKLSLQKIPFTRDGASITLPIPVDGGVQCIDYSIGRVLTMDSALQAKYPQLMSFAAYQKGNPLNDIRIDCDDNNIKMMVRHNGEIFFYQTLPYKNTYLFLAYNKNRAGVIKKPFETNLKK
jgi:hypothetical protein